LNIIINHSSMVPIYEQIVDVVKTQIRKGELKEDENLPVQAAASPQNNH